MLPYVWRRPWSSVFQKLWLEYQFRRNGLSYGLVRIGNTLGLRSWHYETATDQHDGNEHEPTVLPAHPQLPGYDRQGP